MKKKFIILLLLCISCLMFSFGLTACDGSASNSSDSHTHAWAEKWSYDSTYHWHTCALCSLTNDFAEHTDNGGVCLTCGAVLSVADDNFGFIDLGDSYEIFAYNGLTEDVVIPATHRNKPVTVIGDSLFKNHIEIKTATIPENIVSIKDNAFVGCINLTSVTIPASVTEIGTRVFGDCNSLASIAIPASVTKIGRQAFSCCNSLTDVYISDLAAWCKIDYTDTGTDHILAHVRNLYLNGEPITDLVIPNDITSVRRYAFYNCSHIKSVTIPDGVFEIGVGAFASCSELTNVSIPNSVTSIGHSAFSGCSSLTNITIPVSVTSIGNSAFSGCAGIQTENGVQYADKWAISCDINATCITLRANTVGIAHSAFNGCSGLASITIPNGVTSIGDSFYNCSGLTNITIPDSVTAIEQSAFRTCVRLTRIDYHGTKAQWNAITISYGSLDLLARDTVIYCTDGIITRFNNFSNCDFSTKI